MMIGTMKQARKQIRKFRCVAVLVAICAVVLGVLKPVPAQELEKLKTQNLLVITLDGLRWQEVFGGAEKELLTSKRFVTEDADLLQKNYWATTPQERREKLMPLCGVISPNMERFTATVSRGALST